MAKMGSAKGSSRMFGNPASRSRYAADDEESRSRGIVNRLLAKEKGKTEEDKRKETYTWFKDLYNFASANKDHLDDPDVQDILDRKMQKIEATGFFTRSPQRATEETRMIDGLGAVSQRIPEDAKNRALRDIEQLQQRFMMESPNIYKPYTGETVDEQGRPAEVWKDPISGQAQLFQKPPVASTPGTEHIQLREGGADVLHRTPTAEEGREWSINPQPDGSYFIEDKSGRGKPTVVFPPDKEKAGDVKYRKAYELSLKEAAKDLDREMEKGGSMRRKAPWFWFNESDPSWEQRKQKFLEDRINFYMQQQGFGKETKKTTSTSNLTPQQQKADKLLFGGEPQL